MTNPGKSIRVVEGTIYLWAAKGFYLLSGYIIHVFLGRFLGLGDYGVFGTILATASIFDLVVNTGVPQAVSRYLGIRESDVRAVFKTGLRCQLTICTVLSLAFLVCAKLLAGWVLNDHSLTPYLRLLAISFIPVGLLRLYTSALLGVHEYFKASVLYSVESFFRLCLVVILVLMGWRVFGAIWGYVLAAVLPLVWAHWSYDFKETESKRTIGARTLLAFSLPLIIFAGLSSLFLNVGTLMVKGLLRADRAVGLYVAASVLANAPYHLFGSIRGVLMPALSYADGGESVELIKKYIGKGLRVMVFFLVPVIVFLSLNAERIISAFYGNAFSGAGMALKILVVGIGSLALGSTFCVLFDAKGHPWVSVGFLGISLAVSITGNFILIPRAGILGAATATLMAGTMLCCLSGGYVFLRYGSCLPYLSLGRVVLAGILAYGGGYYAMNQSLGLFWSNLLVGSIYVCALFMLGELKQDKPTMRRLLSPLLRYIDSENSGE